MKKLISALLALLLGLGGANAECPKLYMINVGKGDAIIVQADGKNYLIDTGKQSYWSDVKAALKDFEIDTLDGVFMTHTDKDHSGGLKKLADSKIEVKAWYAPAFSTLSREEDPIEIAAAEAGATVTRLNAGDCVDGLFTVLGPISASAYNEDNNSLVMMLTTEYGKVLLAGDMEVGEEAEIIESGADLTCDVFKVPNHADNDVCMAGMIEATGASIALISTDPYDKPGTPDEYLLSRLKKLGMTVYRTDFTKNGIYVKLKKSGIVVEED